LKHRKKLRDEAFLSNGVTRAVVKVPRPLPLPPIDSENTVSKRKTRSEIAVEEVAKEEAKKKPKKTKRSERITPIG